MFFKFSFSQFVLINSGILSFNTTTDQIQSLDDKIFQVYFRLHLKNMLICPSVGNTVIEKTRQFQTWNSFKLIGVILILSQLQVKLRLMYALISKSIQFSSKNPSYFYFIFDSAFMKVSIMNHKMALVSKRFYLIDRNGATFIVEQIWT